MKINNQLHESRVGYTAASTRGQKYTVVGVCAERRGTNALYMVRFESGYERRYTWTSITSGHLIDPTFRIWFGRSVSMPTDLRGSQPRMFSLYYEMFRRCYSEAYQRRFPTYRDCSVCDDWHVFESFREHVSGLENFDKLGTQDLHLDKDLLVPGNRVYGPGLVALVCPQVNASVTAGCSVLDTETGTVYNSYAACGRAVGLSRRTIQRRCSTPGSRWRRV